jgi:hypothetical protein
LGDLLAKLLGGLSELQSAQVRQLELEGLDLDLIGLAGSALLSQELL